MRNDVNRRWILASRPAGPLEPGTFRLDEGPIPEIGDGEFLVRNLWLSFDPAQRGWINDVPSYVPPVQLGEPMAFPNRILRQLQGTDENLRLVLPLLEVRIVEPGKGRMGPGPDMDAIGDGMDPIARKHMLGRLRMASRNPVHVIGEIKG